MTEEEYERAALFWEERDAEEKQMKPEKLRIVVEDFLKSHRICVLASGDVQFIRCTPLEYVWKDGALWVFSEGGKKFLALKNNKHVAVTVFEQNCEFGKLQSMQFDGSVEMIEPFSEAYNAIAAFRKIPIEALMKLKTVMWLLKIRPEEIMFLNSAFKKEGYGSRQTLKYFES